MPGACCLVQRIVHDTVLYAPMIETSCLEFGEDAITGMKDGHTAVGFVPDEG